MKKSIVEMFIVAYNEKTNITLTESVVKTWFNSKNTELNGFSPLQQFNSGAETIDSLVNLYLNS